MLGLLVLAIAPTLFLLLYIYKKDRYEPEPLHLIVWVFFLGSLTVIPAGLLELIFPEGVFSSAVVAPVVEETMKFLVVFLAVYRHPEFDEPMDGIVYAAAASLGFATVENILYVIEGGVVVGIVRAIASVPGHVVFSCIWGFALGIAKFRPEPERAGIIVVGLAGGMLLHGIFNFCLEVFEVAGFLLVLFVIIPLAWWMTSQNIEKAHAHPASARSCQEREAAAARERIAPVIQPVVFSDGTFRNAGEREMRFCTECGAPLHEGMLFCEQCGKRI